MSGPPVCPPQPRHLAFFYGLDNHAEGLLWHLLNAHPRVAVSRGVDALGHLTRGVEPAPVLRAITLKLPLAGCASKAADPDGGAGAGGLIVAGDACGAGAVAQMCRDEMGIEGLRGILPMPFTLIHVINRPTRTIAALARENEPQDALQRYLAYAESASRLYRRYPSLWVDVHAGDIVRHPRATAYQVLRAMGITRFTGAVLSDCAQAVAARCAAQRSSAEPPPLDAGVVRRLDGCGFLERYRRDGVGY